MARISLKEQYDNQSVIKQIVDLTDQIDGYDEEIEQATQTANAAKTTADAAKTEADAVKTTADKALATASEAKTAADAATSKNAEQDTELAKIGTQITELGNKDTEQDTEIASIKAKNTEQDAAIEAVKETADNSLADVTIKTDETSASLLLKNSLAAESSKAVPLASESATGMMTKATYLSLADAQSRITALEGKTIIVYVSFTSDDPSQDEITNLFEAKAGKAPVAGNQAVDIARSLAYQYSGTEWIKTTQEVGQWTNTTAGIIKGTPAGAESAGTLFAEADGTGAVNGWDDLVARVANNESAISTTIPATYATKIALDATDANVANIKQTADAATTKNEGQDTEIAALKTTTGEQSQKIASLEEAIVATDSKTELCYKDAALSDDQSQLVLTKTNGTKTEITLPSGGGTGDIIDATCIECSITPVSKGATGTGDVEIFAPAKLLSGTTALMTADDKIISVIVPVTQSTFLDTGYKIYISPGYLVHLGETNLTTIGTLIFNHLKLSDGVFLVKIALGGILDNAPVLATLTNNTHAPIITLTVSDGELTNVAMDTNSYIPLLTNFTTYTRLGIVTIYKKS